MPCVGKYQVFENIINEIMIVYKHDERPWLIGYSGGKDSTLLVSLVYEAMKRLKMTGSELSKTIYVITSDTKVENPIVKDYMHSSSDSINRAAQRDGLNIQASIIYPDDDQTFWSRVIGLGYPTPEPPGFRWCTERLKINPMNKFVNDRIKESKEIVILLGVRKGESLTRMKTITAREIENKLLNMHNDIPNAYVYNPITEIPNDLVWEFLLNPQADCKSPWGTDMKYLFNLYQGESMGEEQSVLGEVDREKIPVTGNSRFGCWCCTMVKEDKSLQNFINKSSGEDRKATPVHSRCLCHRYCGRDHRLQPRHGAVPHSAKAHRCRPHQRQVYHLQIRHRRLSRQRRRLRDRQQIRLAYEYDSPVYKEIKTTKKSRLLQSALFAVKQLKNL